MKKESSFQMIEYDNLQILAKKEKQETEDWYIFTVCGIEVTAIQKGDTFSTYFSNTPGSFEDLHHVEAIRGLKSVGEALVIGIRFVQDHQWQYIEKVGIYDIYIRHWWQEGNWGYSVRCGGMINHSGFKDKESALAAARICAQEEIQKLDKQIEEEDKVREQRKKKLLN